MIAESFSMIKVILLSICTALVIMLVYWIIPTYISKDDQYIATQFALASASILTLILNVVTYAFESWDRVTEKVATNALSTASSGLFL